MVRINFLQNPDSNLFLKKMKLDKNKCPIFKITPDSFLECFYIFSVNYYINDIYRRIMPLLSPL